MPQAAQEEESYHCNYLVLRKVFPFESPSQKHCIKQAIASSSCMLIPKTVQRFPLLTE